MTEFISLLIVSILLNAFNLTRTGEILCSFPGTPNHGSIKPHQQTYRPGQNATFKCEKNLKMKGISTISCLSTGTWNLHYPPLCLRSIEEELIDRTTQSSTFMLLNSSLALDESYSTCSSTNPYQNPYTYQNDSEHFWEVHFLSPVQIGSIYVKSRPDPTYNSSPFKLKLEIISGKHQYIYHKTLCKDIVIPDRSQNFKDEQYLEAMVSCQIQTIGFAIRITNMVSKEPLKLCMVKIFPVPEVLGCGKPEIYPNCEAHEEKPDGVHITKATYTSKPGYKVDVNDNVRYCDMNTGKWPLPTPKCINVVHEGILSTVTTVPMETARIDLAIIVSFATMGLIILVFITFLCYRLLKRFQRKKRLIDPTPNVINSCPSVINSCPNVINSCSNVLQTSTNESLPTSQQNLLLRPLTDHVYEEIDINQLYDRPGYEPTSQTDDSSGYMIPVHHSNNTKQLNVNNSMQRNIDETLHRKIAIVAPLLEQGYEEIAVAQQHDRKFGKEKFVGTPGTSKNFTNKPNTGKFASGKYPHRLNNNQPKQNEQYFSTVRDPTKPIPDYLELIK